MTLKDITLKASVLGGNAIIKKMVHSDDTDNHIKLLIEYVDDSGDKQTVETGEIELTYPQSSDLIAITTGIDSAIGSGTIAYDKYSMIDVSATAVQAFVQQYASGAAVSADGTLITDMNEVGRYFRVDDVKVPEKSKFNELLMDSLALVHTKDVTLTTKIIPSKSDKFNVAYAIMEYINAHPLINKAAADAFIT